MKQTIKLRESELKRMIAESVKRVLRESVGYKKWTKQDLDEFAQDVLGGMVYGRGIIRTYTNEDLCYSISKDRRTLEVEPDNLEEPVDLSNLDDYGKFEITYKEGSVCTTICVRIPIDEGI